MIPPVPKIEDYGIAKEFGFLPPELPLERLPGPYYAKWEAIVINLQALLLSKRLREVVRKLPVLSTSHLQTPSEWRRAYLVLAFITHGYIWGGDVPEERIPPPIAIPLQQVCKKLELPPVATYAGLCLWNFRPIFADEPIDSLENLATLSTFSGSLDESWFYLVSVAIEARGAPLIPLMLDAMNAVRSNDSATVTAALKIFAECLDELGTLLNRMYENCDPHVFYHRIRPFLAGSKNMADAGLPNGIIYEDGSGTEEYHQYGGGSNAQSSLIQFFDVVLGVSHRPTGFGPTTTHNSSKTASPTAPPSHNNFILEMRNYMPGPHARFVRDVAAASNIRAFVASHPEDHSLTIAYDACLAMLRALRDKHIRMVSRYIIVKSRESRSHSRSLSPRAAPQLLPQKINLATGTRAANSLIPGAKRSGSGSGSGSDKEADGRASRSKTRGTGGTSLIPFLKQARDETGEPAIGAWARGLLGDKPVAGRRAAVAGATTTFTRANAEEVGAGAAKKSVDLGKWGEHADGVVQIVGLAGTWGVDESEGGLCHW